MRCCAHDRMDMANAIKPYECPSGYFLLSRTNEEDFLKVRMFVTFVIQTMILILLVMTPFCQVHALKASVVYASTIIHMVRGGGFTAHIVSALKRGGRTPNNERQVLRGSQSHAYICTLTRTGNYVTMTVSAFICSALDMLHIDNRYTPPNGQWM